MSTITLNNQSHMQDIPSESQLEQWVKHALEPTEHFAEIGITMVNEQEIQSLNKQFRKKNKPTNVLAFPNEAPPEYSEDFLGDIVICPQVIEQEAKAQDKPYLNHWAHMIIHATLHLQGYDHLNKDDAQLMEAKETELLSELGIPNPYEDTHE